MTFRNSVLVGWNVPESRQGLRESKVSVRLVQHGQNWLGRRAHPGILAPIVLGPALVPPNPELLLHTLQHDSFLLSSSLASACVATSLAFVSVPPPRSNLSLSPSPARLRSKDFTRRVEYNRK